MGSKECNKCKGTGKVKNKECSKCNGCGWLSCRCGSYSCLECNTDSPRSKILFPGCSFGKCND